MRAGGAGPRGYAVRALAGPLRSNTFTALRVASPRVPPHRPGRPDRQLRDFRVNRASRPLPRRAPHPAWGERPRRGPGGVRAGTTRGIAAARPTPGVLARGSLPHQLRARLHGLGLHPSPESWAYAHGAGRASWRVPHARQGARSSFPPSFGFPAFCPFRPARVPALCPRGRVRSGSPRVTHSSPATRSGFPILYAPASDSALTETIAAMTPLTGRKEPPSLPSKRLV